MFAVMIGNEPGDSTRIKRTVSLLQDIVTMAAVDTGRIAGISHDIPDIIDLLSWYKNVDNVMNTMQHADTAI